MFKNLIKVILIISTSIIYSSCMYSQQYLEINDRIIKEDIIKKKKYTKLQTQKNSEIKIEKKEDVEENPITKKLTFNYLYGKNKAELFSILGMPKINLRDGNTKIFIYKNDSCIVHFIMSNTNIESNMIIEHISIQKIKPNCLGSFFNMNNTK